MFDDRLQEIIMEEMMSQFGKDVRTDEGSLAYNACAKIAEKLEEVYGDMDEINDNLLPDRQDIGHLIRYAKERGITYNYATAPIVEGTFQQEIEIGEQFTCGEYIYTVTEWIEGCVYKLECSTAGTESNTTMGALEPLDYIDDFQGGEITDILQLGTDDENEDLFRQRVLASFQYKSFGGNKQEYRQHVNKITGVGGCKPLRREADSPWINIHIISGDYDPPTQELIDNVQTAVDPEQNHGEGDGIAPICHNVKIYGVGTVEVNVSTSITFDTGYSAETSKSQIVNAIDDYLLTLRKGWQANETNDTIVRIAQIEARIINVEGVLDVKNTAINGTEENLIIGYTDVPVIGGVSIV